MVRNLAPVLVDAGWWAKPGASHRTPSRRRGGVTNRVPALAAVGWWAEPGRESQNTFAALGGVRQQLTLVGPDCAIMSQNQAAAWGRTEGQKGSVSRQFVDAVALCGMVRRRLGGDREAMVAGVGMSSQSRKTPRLAGSAGGITERPEELSFDRRRHPSSATRASGGRQPSPRLKPGEGRGAARDPTV